MRKYIFFALVLVGCRHAEPDLGETLQWMHDFVAVSGGFYSTSERGYWRDSYVFDSHGCHVTLTDKAERREDPSLKDYIETSDFSLKDLDPATVKTVVDPSPATVDAETFNSRELIIRKEDGVITYPAHGIGVFFYKGEDAQRFATALRHAIVLCGRQQP
jgi:hypothetical protein